MNEIKTDKQTIGACIRYIREHGEQAYAEEMAQRGQQTMKR